MTGRTGDLGGVGELGFLSSRAPFLSPDVRLLDRRTPSDRGLKLNLNFYREDTVHSITQYISKTLVDY